MHLGDDLLHGHGWPGRRRKEYKKPLLRIFKIRRHEQRGKTKLDFTHGTNRFRKQFTVKPVFHVQAIN